MEQEELAPYPFNLQKILQTIFQTPDMIEQHQLLDTAADLIDSNKIKTTLTEVLSPINAENLRKAHRKLESGTMIGKIVLSRF